MDDWDGSAKDKQTLSTAETRYVSKMFQIFEWHVCFSGSNTQMKGYDNGKGGIEFLTSFKWKHTHHVEIDVKQNPNYKNKFLSHF